MTTMKVAVIDIAEAEQSIGDRQQRQPRVARLPRSAVVGGAEGRRRRHASPRPRPRPASDDNAAAEPHGPPIHWPADASAQISRAETAMPVPTPEKCTAERPPRPTALSRSRTSAEASTST